MSDIDFDELDREVNKLVGKETSPTMMQSDVSTAPKEDFADVVEISEGATEQISPEVSQKPRGRFMDVVHPSSDMSTSKDTFSNKTERKSLQPIDDTPDEKQAVINDSSTDMPDPLELHEARETEKASVSLGEPSSDSAAEDSHETAIDSKELSEAEGSYEDKQDTHVEDKEVAFVKGEPIEEEQSEPEKDTPTSVFIADAQTEKRPLGGIVKEDVNEKDEASEPFVGEPTIELPPELDKSLVAIEAGESLDDIPEPDTPIKQDEELEVSKKTEDIEKPKQNSSINGLLASGSIPQQYRQAAEKIAQQDTHAKPLFFDAQHYATTPAIAAKKQKSGFMHLLQWVFIVIGLLLLGGTLGAAIFVFVNGQ